jgi:imidazolonepropionase-like amidohydrolase
MIALKAQQLIDGTGQPPVLNGIILVEGNKILGVGSEAQVMVPADAKWIDLGEATLLPGLIESHTHLSVCPECGYEPERLGLPDADLAFRWAKNARTLLRLGVTTARIPGERNHVDFAYRRAWEAGFVRGPRVVISGPGLQARHGHGAGFIVLVDGVEDVRRAVRENIRAGADFIKIFITGGTGTLGTPVTTSYYTEAEIAAAIEEAHRVGKPIAAHAHGGSGAKFAVKEGVDNLEHGAFMDEELIELLVRHKTWLNPNLALYFRQPQSGENPLPPEVMQKRNEARDNLAIMFPKAVQAGVRIVAGTDGRHEQMWFELACMVQLGVSPIDAIMAATKHGAETCRLEDRLGTLEVGKIADVIAVRGDPLADITAMKNIAFVMQDGRSFQLID